MNANGSLEPNQTNKIEEAVARLLIYTLLKVLKSAVNASKIPPSLTLSKGSQALCNTIECVWLGNFCLRH